MPRSKATRTPRRSPADPEPKGIGTLCVQDARLRRDGRGRSAPLGEPVALPLFQTSTFAFRTPQEMLDVFEERTPGWVYTRYGNPTLAAVERKIAKLEGAPAGLLFSSGMAAITTSFLALCRAGDRIVVQRDLYGGTQALLGSLLPGLGIRVDVVDASDLAGFTRALRKRARVLYLESPTNPLLKIPDVPEICRRARESGAVSILDSTFGSPVLQRPLGWGVDLVLHSGSKYLGGHSDLICGAAAGSLELIERMSLTRRALGAIPEPIGAWLLDRGMKTLELRVRRSCETALELARRLEGNPKVLRVHYPGLPSHPDHERASALMDGGFGGVLSFEMRGGRRAVLRCMEGFRWILLASSLGGVESLVSHPATTSHAGLTAAGRKEQGIGEGLVRLSVGLESLEDLWDDLERGLVRV